MTRPLPPVPPPSAASATMRSNRQRDTGPELRLRRSLHARGHRYRVALPIPLSAGRRVRPDIVFTRQRLAIFVDGCYWHCCPDHGRAPSDPTGYWAAKLRRNVERDTAVTSDLESMGWKVLRVWEHVDVGDALAIIEEIVAPASAGAAPSLGPAQSRLRS